MDFLRRDLVFALRSLRRGSGVAAVMVAILSLGIGANTAIFSVVRAVILRPLSYPSPDRLVMLPARHRPNEMGAEVSVANFLDWRRESRSFSQLGAWAPASANVTGGDAPERLAEAARQAAVPSDGTEVGALPAVTVTDLDGREADSRRSRGTGRSRRAVGHVVSAMPRHARLARSAQEEVWRPARGRRHRRRFRRGGRPPAREGPGPAARLVDGDGGSGACFRRRDGGPDASDVRRGGTGGRELLRRSADAARGRRGELASVAGRSSGASR
jgi:hypothetical protein